MRPFASFVCLAAAMAVAAVAAPQPDDKNPPAYASSDRWDVNEMVGGGTYLQHCKEPSRDLDGVELQSVQLTPYPIQANNRRPLSIAIAGVAKRRVESGVVHVHMEGHGWFRKHGSDEHIQFTEYNVVEPGDAFQLVLSVPKPNMKPFRSASIKIDARDQDGQQLFCVEEDKKRGIP